MTYKSSVSKSGGKAWLRQNLDLEFKSDLGWVDLVTSLLSFDPQVPVSFWQQVQAFVLAWLSYSYGLLYWNKAKPPHWYDLIQLPTYGLHLHATLTCLIVSVKVSLYTFKSSASTLVRYSTIKSSIHTGDHLMVRTSQFYGHQVQVRPGLFMVIQPSKKPGIKSIFRPGMAISIHTASAGMLLLICLIVSIKVSLHTPKQSSDLSQNSPGYVATYVLVTSYLI